MAWLKPEVWCFSSYQLRTADEQLLDTARRFRSASAYCYDGFGELAGASNVTETLGFAYDAAGQVTSATAAPTSGGDPEPSVTLQYGYDAAGEPASVTGPAGPVGYGYSLNGLLNQVTDPSGGVFGISHDANGRRTALTRPNGVSDAYSYDAADQLLGIDSTGAGGSTVAFDHYTYTANGLRASLTNPDGVTSYGYDAGGELTSASYPAASGLAGESFSYDPIGDQIQAAQSYDGAGRLTADATSSYGYDREGNLTSRTNTATGAITRYTWNSAHQLLAVTPPTGSPTSFGYDPLGRRVDVTTGSGRVHTVYGGTHPTATYDVTGARTASFVYGAGQNDQLEETLTGGGGSFYYLHDALGSVTALTDSSGAVADSYRYSAFGQVHATGTAPNPFTYIGAPTDPTTGLVYLNARYLDPTTGRFISEDPVPAASLYTYTHDDPTNLSDASGRIAEEEDVEAALYAAGSFSDDEAEASVDAGAERVVERAITKGVQNSLESTKAELGQILDALPGAGDSMDQIYATTQATVTQATKVVDQAETQLLPGTGPEGVVLAGGMIGQLLKSWSALYWLSLTV